MGYPSDVKSPEGPLPTYVPIPSDHDTPLSELPSAETRRRRLRTLVKHLVVLLFTSFILYHVLKKSNKGVAKISCVDVSWTCAFAASNCVLTCISAAALGWTPPEELPA